MWKKILFAIILVIILVLGIELFNVVQKKEKTEEENMVNVVESETELSSQYVTDECINEWEDYALTVQNKLQEASGSLNDENKLYILRAKNNIINVYYINENNEEILYKVTDISIEYLPEEDAKNLEQGIEVKGIQNLNQLLEDFE